MIVVNDSSYCVVEKLYFIFPAELRPPCTADAAAI